MKKILLIAVLLGAMLSVTVYFVCIAAPSVFFGKGLNKTALADVKKTINDFLKEVKTHERHE